MEETKQWAPGGETKQVTEQKTMLSIGWIALAILLPLAGVIAGIWGVHKEDKKDGGTLIALSIGAWFFWFIWAL